MKKTILSAMTALSGLSLCAAGFDGLTLKTNDWFDASFQGVASQITQGSAVGITHGAGSWTNVPGEGVTNGGSGYITLATEPSENLTFTPAPFSVTSGYETVVANIKPEVTDGDLITLTDVQAAFCIQVDDGTLKAMGYTSEGWKDISYTAASTSYSVESLTNVWFTLYMDFAKDNSTRYVRYSVKPDDGTLAVLTDSAGVSWFETANKETIESISFTGSGLVKTFSGDELTEPLTFTDPVFTYMANYESATTVVATVTGAVASGTTFTLTVGDANYTGTYNSANGEVTFYDVKNLNLGETVSYTISAAGATAGSSGEQTTVVGNVSGGWILETRGHTGSGTWTDSSGAAQELDYSSESPYAAALSDYLFTPTNSVGDAVVTVISQVCFGDVADTSVNPGDDSYAAFRLGDVSGTPTFQVWVKGSEDSAAAWVNVSGSGVTPSAKSVYTLTSKFDFIKGTCEFFIDGTQLVNGQTFKFYLANNIRKMSSIKFNGTGSLVSLNGSYVKGAEFKPAGANAATVDSSWVAEYLGTNTVAEAEALLATDSEVKTMHNGVGYNYYECYALGINPANSDEAPVVSAAPAESGIKMSLAGISVPEGVTLTVRLKQSSNGADYSEVAGKTATVVGGSTAGDITIENIPGGVMRYKMDISIGATAP